MERFQRLEAVALPLAIDNLDTDQLFPARFMRQPRTGGNYGQFFLHDHRFDAEGRPRPEFPLNRAAYRDARIIVGARNYGCGSSRIGAVFVHLDYGIRAIVAESFGDVFFNNCLKQGVLAIRLPAPVVNRLREQLLAAPGSPLAVDLEEQVVEDADGTRFRFEIDAFARKAMLEGLSDIQLTLSYEDDIASFEDRYFARKPWLRRAPAGP